MGSVTCRQDSWTPRAEERSVALRALRAEPRPLPASSPRPRPSHWPQAPSWLRLGPRPSRDLGSLQPGLGTRPRRIYWQIPSPFKVCHPKREHVMSMHTRGEFMSVYGKTNTVL